MTFFPPPQPRKTVDELFYEAVQTTYPETRLGLQEAPHPQYAPEVMAEPGYQDGFEMIDSIPPAPHLDQTFPTDPLMAPAYGPQLNGHAPQYQPSNPHQPSNSQPNGQLPQLQPMVDPSTTSPMAEPSLAPQLIAPPMSYKEPSPQTHGGMKRSTVKVDLTPRHLRQPRKQSMIVQTAHTAQSAAPAGETMVNDFFEETDVRQAIQSLATQANKSVIMDDQIAGVVSVVIESDTFEGALQKVLLPLGMIYKKRDDGAYLVGTSDPSSALFPLIAVQSQYRPLHINPKDLVAILPDRLKQFARIVDKRNIILIEAPEAMAEDIHNHFQQTDQPIPQVMLEAIICVVSPDSGFRFGLDWGHAVQLNDKSMLDLGMQGLALNGAISPAGLKDAFSDFAITSAFVQLLAQEGYISIRAAPRVMARDGERAEISIARQTFFSTQPQSSDVFFRQDIQEVEAGINLIITPTVRGDNVEVVIEKAEVSEDIRSSQTDPQLTDNPFPLINRRRVTTTVNVKDSRTLVIGGLMQRQTVERISEVPGFGSVPKVGKLFQRVEQQDQEAEVVIFISPKIITQDKPTAVCPLPGSR